MKKIVCVLAALILCLSSAAMAEYVPSKTTSDLTRFTVEAANPSAAADFQIMPVTQTTVPAAEYQKYVESCEKEIDKLMASSSVEEYFAGATDAQGNEVSFAEILGTEKANVYELAPFIVSGYDAQVGNVKANLQFSTPYKKGEKVVVMIGRVVINPDNTQTVIWTAYEGIGTGNMGVEVELDSEMLLELQNGIAMMAVVSE